jgi:hypothetical protein
VTQFVSVLEKNERDCWFQQYGATANTAKATEAFLQNFFGYRAVGRRLWPPRSPDLTPPYFFFFVGEFLIKESTAITQEAQRPFNVALHGLFPAPSTNS